MLSAERVVVRHVPAIAVLLVERAESGLTVDLVSGLGVLVRIEATAIVSALEEPDVKMDAATVL